MSKYIFEMALKFTHRSQSQNGVHLDLQEQKIDSGHQTFEAYNSQKLGVPARIGALYDRTVFRD